ncbi:hypothetical protein RKD49_002575 [Streptomyces glaucescens]
MAEPKGHACPECGAARGADNTPSCACGRRASDALRDARTAEQAAAGDFDPLRIRPYVDLDGTGERPAAPQPTGAEPADAELTMPLRPVGPEPVTSVLPTPLAPPPSAPSTDDLDLFEDAPRPETDGPGPQGPHARRRRRTVLLGVAGAVVAVVAAAGLASGLFSYDKPSRDTALPEDVREAVPEARTSEASRPAAPSTGASASATSASPSPSASASPSPSPSPSASSASPTPTPTETPTPTQSATTDRATASPAPEQGPVLRRGDRGPEVTELQLRLRQLYLYNDEPHGVFNNRVEEALRNYQWSRGLQDELNVYGARTRQLLETETREP